MIYRFWKRPEPMRFALKWTYFKEEEVKGLQEDLVYKLDRARELYGKPLIITSGYRTPEHNLAIGGVKNSLHTKGLAVDIRGPKDPFEREKLAWALGSAGFRQIGSYKKDGHYHIEIDRDSSPCFWGHE